MTSLAARTPHHAGAGSVLPELSRLALMALCLSQAWVIVFVLRIGPVIATVDAEHGMGVHSGDVLAFPLVLMALVLGTHGLVRHTLTAPTGPRLAPLARAH